MTLYRVHHRTTIIEQLALDALLQDGVLIPAEPCVHGNYARHIINMQSLIGNQWCDGKPTKTDPL